MNCAPTKFDLSINFPTRSGFEAKEVAKQTRKKKKIIAHPQTLTWALISLPYQRLPHLCLQRLLQANYLFLSFNSLQIQPTFNFFFFLPRDQRRTNKIALEKKVINHPIPTFSKLAVSNWPTANPTSSFGQPSQIRHVGPLVYNSLTQSLSFL